MALAIIFGSAMVFMRGLQMVRAFKQKTLAFVFCLMVIVALAIGVWFGIFHEFQLNDRIRIQGVPVPLVVFVLEGQNWTDFVKPLVIGYMCMAADGLFPVGVICLLFIMLLRSRMKSKLV